MCKTKASETKLNSTESEMSSSNPCGFYFSVWCCETEYSQTEPWKIQQIIAQNAQTAAEMFVKDYDKEADRFFAKNVSSQFNNSQCSDRLFVYVQDWRGLTTKFEIVVESQPVYYARRI